MAKQAETKKVEFVAYADFEWQGKQYVQGDVFAPPANLKRDVSFEEFRNTSRLNHPGKIGVPFVYEIEVAKRKNEQTGATEAVMDARRVILPVEEKGAEAA